MHDKEKMEREYPLVNFTMIQAFYGTGKMPRLQLVTFNLILLICYQHSPLESAQRVGKYKYSIIFQLHPAPVHYGCVSIRIARLSAGLGDCRHVDGTMHQAQSE